MDKLVIPKFETQKESIAFLIENEHSLAAQKCSAIKFADGFEAPSAVLKNEIGSVTKSMQESNPDESRDEPGA